MPSTCVRACIKFRERKNQGFTAVGQFLGISRSNPRTPTLEFWGYEVQPIALHPTKLPASTTEFKLKQHSQPGLYIFVVWVTGLKWILKGVQSGTQMGPRPKKELVLGHIVGVK